MASTFACSVGGTISVPIDQLSELEFEHICSESEKQGLIDEIIPKLKRVIIRLKNQRNGFSPVGRLPPEVLGRIFVWAASFDNDWNFSPARHFNFSFVSQRWRNVAISTPDVWSTLPTRYPKWRHVMLERSKLTGLTLEATINSRRTLSFWEISLQDTIINQAERFKSLSFSLFITEDLGSTLRWFPATTPRLKSLRVGVHGAMDPVQIPDDRFRDACLVILDLKNCTISWPSLMLTSLKHLKLVHDRRSPRNTRLPDLLDALQQMSNIETLELDHAIPREDAYQTNNSKPHIVLSSLRYLTIISLPIEVAKVLRCLSIPASTTLDLRCDNYHSNDLNTWPTIALAISCLFSSMTGPAPAYRIFSLGERGIEALYDESSYSSSASYIFPRLFPRDQPNFSLQFSQRIGSNQTAVATSALFLAIPHSHVETLVLGTVLEPDDFVPLFGGLPKLKTFRIKGRAEATDFLSAIKSSTASNSKDAISRVTFPHLENLVLEYGDLVSREHPSTAEKLLDVVKEQSEQRCPLQRLTIRGSRYVSEDNIKALQNFVAHVEYDDLDDDRFDKGNSLDYDSDY